MSEKTIDFFNMLSEETDTSKKVNNNIPENAPVMKADTGPIMNSSNNDSKMDGMYAPILENNYIDNSGIAVGSLPRDSFYSVQAYAKSKFPDMPLEESMKRFGVADGRIFYLGTDGKRYYATPNFSAVLKNPSNIDEFALRGTGPSIPIITGTGAGMVGMTTGPVTGVASAVAGGGAGEVIRQSLSNYYTGEEMPIGQRVGNVGKSALMEGGGQFLGNVFNKAIKTVLTKMPDRLGKKFSIFDTKAKDEIVNISNKHGIKLTTAEISSDPALIRMQKMLTGVSGSDEILESFYNIRNKDVQNALLNMFETLNTNKASANLIYKSGIESAEQVITKENQILRDQAKALYTKAYEINNVNTSETLELLNTLISKAKGNNLSQLLKVKDMLFKDVDVPVSGPTMGGNIPSQKKSIVETSLEALDGVKREIDDIINQAGSSDKSIAPANAVNFVKLKEMLLKNMDDVSPEYSQARGIYEAGKPSITATATGMVGYIAKQNPNRYIDIGNMLFNSKTSSIADIKNVREAFNKFGYTKEFNQIVGAYLEESFEKILKDEAIGQNYNLAGKFYNKLFGNQKQREMMLEAMSNNPNFARDFADLMLVFNGTQKAMKSESITAWMQQAMKEFANESKSLTGQVIKTIEIWNQPSRIAGFLDDLKKDKMAVKFANMLTTTEGRKELAKLRDIGINTKKGVILFTHILNGGTITNLTEGPEKDVEMGQMEKGSY